MRAWAEDEEGSQIVGHVLVQVLVVFVVLGLLQLAFALHTRNLAIDAASEGARRAALLDGTVEEGVARVEALMDATLGSEQSRSVRVYETLRSGQPVLVAEVATTLPVLGPLGFSQKLKVSASAWKEPR